MFIKTKEKSAEVIVVVGNEPLERTEVSQNSEGLNIKLLSMLHRVNNSLQQKRKQERKEVQDD